MVVFGKPMKRRVGRRDCWSRSSNSWSIFLLSGVGFSEVVLIPSLISFSTADMRFLSELILSCVSAIFSWINTDSFVWSFREVWIWLKWGVTVLAMVCLHVNSILGAFVGYGLFTCQFGGIFSFTFRNSSSNTTFYFIRQLGMYCFGDGGGHLVWVRDFGAGLFSLTLYISFMVISCFLNVEVTDFSTDWLTISLMSWLLHGSLVWSGNGRGEEFALGGLNEIECRESSSYCREKFWRLL